MAGGIKAVIATQFDATGLNKAIKEFDKLGSSLKGILGATGLTVGLSGVVNVLKESATAAIGDVKSQALLANQLRNTVGASDAQIASVEASIKAMQMQAAVADDDIRPAFASLVRATGDVTRATSLTSLALDVAAGTGKDLGAVSLALGKAVNGSTTSLLKLVPSIKGASNPMGELASQFAGAAAEAAKNDPIQRLTVVMGELQEQLGTYLLPALEDFAGFLADSATQDSITWMIDEFGAWTKQMGLAADGVFYLGDQINSFFKTISGGFEQTPFTDFLSGLADRAMLALNPLQKLINILQQYGLIAKSQEVVVSGPKISKGLTANEKFLLEQSLKTPTKPGPKGDPNAAAKKAADARAAIAKAIAAANAEMAKAAEEAMATYREQVIAYSEQITAVNDYKNSLLGLTDAIKPLAFEEKVLGRFAQASADSFDAIAANIRENSKMFLDGGASLLAYVAKERKAIEQLAAQRDALAEKYSLAKAVKTDVEAAIKSFGNITGLLTKQSTMVTETMTTVVDGIQMTRSKLVEQTTTSDIVANFQAILDKTKAFAVSLKKLRELGLDQNLYKQIVDAGVDAGGQTAEAILAGGSDTVGSLNSIFKDLNAVGADIGEQTAQVMYGAGVDLTNGLLEGIKSKDQELIDQAKAMAQAFSQAFNMELSLNLATPTAPVVPGFGIDATDFIPGYGRVSSTGTNPSGGNVYNVKVEAGLIANKQELPAMIVDALGTYTRQSGAGGLNRVLGL